MSTTRRQGRGFRHARWAALTAAAGLALAGCAGGSSDSGADRAQAPASTSAPAADSESQAPGASDSTKKGRTATKVTPESSRKLARTASMSLTVKDVEQTTAKIRSLGEQKKGWVSKEESRSYASSTGGSSSSRGSSSSSRPRTWSEVTLQVPVDELDSTMTELSELGKVTRRATETQDVTASHTDTATRVTTMKKSIKRLQALIDSTDDLDQIISLEDELSTREADLESLETQLQDLEDRTATAPITISLTQEGEEQTEETDSTGFVAGLKSGWGAFTGALHIGATVLGALTPFILAGALLLSPVYLWWRRRSRRSAQPAAASSAPSAPQQ